MHTYIDNISYTQMFTLKYMNNKVIYVVSVYISITINICLITLK